MWQVRKIEGFANQLPINNSISCIQSGGGGNKEYK